MSFTYFLILVIDLETFKWKCNICGPGIEYTVSQIAAHLYIVHKIKKMFQCSICQFDHYNYDELVEHFKAKHPSQQVKYLNVHFEKVSSHICLIMYYDKVLVSPNY